MRVQPKTAVGLVTVGGAFGFFALNPAPFASAQAANAALSGGVACLFWVLACLGCGSWFQKEQSAVEAFAFGAGVYGLLLGVTSMIFGVHIELMTVTGGLGICALFFRNRPTVSWPPKHLLALIGIVLMAASIDAFSPAIDTDEIYQHLALPQQFLLDGTLGGGVLQPDASRPLPVHILYTALMGLGGVTGPKLFHLCLVGFLLLGLWDIAERRVGPGAGAPATLLLIGSYSFLREMGLAYNNLPVALWCLLALEQAMGDRPKKMALFSGMALAAKYTAAPAIAGIFLAWWIKKGLRFFPQAVAWGALALCVVAPWWLHNLSRGHHALFPYAGWDSSTAQFMMLEKYGMGRSLTDLVSLPWNLTVHGDPNSFVFLGRVSPAGLLLLPAGLILSAKKHREIWIAASVAFLGWALGPHWLRYLLPAAPLLALALAGGFLSLPARARWVIWAAFFIGIPANIGPWAQDLAARAPYTFGQNNIEEGLAKDVPGWKAVEWINENTPVDNPVALFFAWPKSYIERPVLLGSVEDHVPSRVHLEQNEDQALSVLKNAGVRHILAGGACDGCRNFLRKSYPFLSEQEFQTQFQAPELQLKKLLLKEATKVFESGKYSVWRLL